MALARYRPEFDEFLYAPVGLTDEEAALSVLSALARQNLDPWEEAAQLAQLSKESAIARLTSLIASVTVGVAASDTSAAATRLAALLPRSDQVKIPSFCKTRDRPQRSLAPVIIYLIVGALILASALFGN